MANLIAYLNDTGVLNDSDVQRVMAKVASSHESLQSILIGDKYVTPDVLAKAISATTGLMYLGSLDSVEFDDQLASTIGYELLIRLKSVPIKVNQSSALAVWNPEDDEIISLRSSYGLNLRVCPVDILEKFSQITLQSEIISRSAQDIQVGSDMQFGFVELTDNDEGVQAFLKHLLTYSLKMRVSDIQIIPMHKHVGVYLRIDGHRCFHSNIPKHVPDRLARVLRNMANLSGTDDTANAEGKIEVALPTGSLSIRINIIHTRTGPSINIRLLSNDITKFDDLGFTRSSQANTIRDMMALPSGLILIVGPVGSGKSTTMRSILVDMLKNNVNINTVEDPVEVLIEGMNQVDIVPEKTTFADIIKSFLRHDPDVICVGEIRDVEVGLEVCRAAETGRLVLSSLHTGTACAAPARMVNLGIPPSSVADNLIGIICQRLIRKICPHCKTTYPVPIDSHIHDLLGLENKVTQLSYGKGCEFCNNSGYYGRTIICEVALLDTKARNMISKSVSAYDLEQYLKTKGFITYVEDGIEKVVEGITTIEEIMPFLLERRAAR